jgi:hypothetical protein
VVYALEHDPDRNAPLRGGGTVAGSTHSQTHNDVRRPAVPGSVIVSGARTPMGKLLGGLKDFSGA